MLAAGLARVHFSQGNKGNVSCYADLVHDKSFEWGSISGSLQKTRSPEVVYDVFNSIGTAAYAFSFEESLSDVQVREFLSVLL